MKALSGYAEWFWLMAKNWKDVENRPKSLPKEIAFILPVRIYLHASKSDHVQQSLFPDDLVFIREHLTCGQWAEFCQVGWKALRGMIIGEITITGQIRKHHYVESDHVDMGSQQKELEIAKANNEPYMSPWFFGPFGYVVKDGMLYTRPIPCKGKLGFFEPDIRRATLSALS